MWECAPIQKGQTYHRATGKSVAAEELEERGRVPIRSMRMSRTDDVPVVISMACITISISLRVDFI